MNICGGRKIKMETNTVFILNKKNEKIDFRNNNGHASRLKLQKY